MKKWISELIAKEFGNAMATPSKLVKIEIFESRGQEPRAPKPVNLWHLNHFNKENSIVKY